MQAHSLYTTDRRTIGLRSAGSSDPPLGSTATMLCSMTLGHLWICSTTLYSLARSSSSPKG
eukprot:10984934-Heterocapsa_arctica.AAC.1